MDVWKFHFLFFTICAEQGCTWHRPSPFERPATRYNGVSTPWVGGRLQDFGPRGFRLQGFRIFGCEGPEMVPKAPKSNAKFYLKWNEILMTRPLNIHDNLHSDLIKWQCKHHRTGSKPSICIPLVTLVITRVYILHIWLNFTFRNTVTSYL